MTPIECFVFVGPTGYGLELPRVEGLAYRAPVRRGDIDALVAAESPSALAIVDGTYHSYPAVAHQEIRRALEAGWEVWGLSSMGAIRAAEMHTMGVRGFGEVFDAFLQDGDFADDEVALLHGTEAPFAPISEPLIHIRSLMKSLEAEGLVAPAIASSVVGTLKQMWFGRRTIGRLRSLLAEHDCPHVNMDIRPHRIKSADLLRFLQITPWTKRTEHVTAIA